MCSAHPFFGCPSGVGHSPSSPGPAELRLHLPDAAAVPPHSGQGRLLRAELDHTSPAPRPRHRSHPFVQHLRAASHAVSSALKSAAGRGDARACRTPTSQAWASTRHTGSAHCRCPGGFSTRELRAVDSRAGPPQAQPLPVGPRSARRQQRPAGRGEVYENDGLKEGGHAAAGPARAPDNDQLDSFDNNAEEIWGNSLWGCQGLSHTQLQGKRPILTA